MCGFDQQAVQNGAEAELGVPDPLHQLQVLQEGKYGRRFVGRKANVQVLRGQTVVKPWSNSGSGGGPVLS